MQARTSSTQLSWLETPVAGKYNNQVAKDPEEVWGGARGRQDFWQQTFKGNKNGVRKSFSSILASESSSKHPLWNSFITFKFQNVVNCLAWCYRSEITAFEGTEAGGLQV